MNRAAATTLILFIAMTCPSALAAGVRRGEYFSRPLYIYNPFGLSPMSPEEQTNPRTIGGNSRVQHAASDLIAPWSNQNTRNPLGDQ